MKVWEYLDFFARCYGIPADRRADDDRRPARAGRPRPTSATPTSQTPVARHAAAAVPRPRAGPRPAGAAPRRAGVGPRPARARRAARAAPRAARAGQDDPDQQPHPPRARGAVHRASRSSTAAGCSPRAGSPTSSARCARPRAARRRPRRRTAIAAAADWLGTDPRVATSWRRSSAGRREIELGFHGDDDGRPALLPGDGRGRPPRRRLRAGGERPRGAVPPGHRTGSTEEAAA